MFASALAVAMLIGQDSSVTPRDPSPFAPSLPKLTPDEEKKLDAVVDRFIEADTGKLKEADAERAMEDFRRSARRRRSPWCGA